MHPKPVIGLVRHRVTETPGTSVGDVFSDWEAAVSRSFQVELLPAYYRSLPPPKKWEVGAEFLKRCRLILPGNALNLFPLREEIGSQVPMLYLNLGGLPRGAVALRKIFPYFRPTDTIAFTSRADQRILNTLMKSCAARQVYLPFGIDEELFQPSAVSERHRYRELFGFTEKDIVFAYIGRVTVEKNVHAIIRIFSELVEEYKDIHLLVVGPMLDIPFGEFQYEAPDLVAHIKELRSSHPLLTQRIKWFGGFHKEVLPLFYNLADIFINLTLHHDENFGYTQVEAMSCGKPVIGTDWGGLQDTIHHQETGFKIPTFLTHWGVQIDRYSLLNSCKALIESAELREEMSKNARAVAVADYAMAVFQNRLETEILRMLNPREHPSGGPNQLSNFGLKYHFTFSEKETEENGQLRSMGAVSPSYTAENYDLYAGLICPYTSGHVRTEIQDSDVLFFAPASVSIEDSTLRITDVLWPQVYSAAALEMKLIRYLIEKAYIPYQELLDEFQGVAGEEEIHSHLVTLMINGIVVKSAGVRG